MIARRSETASAGNARSAKRRKRDASGRRNLKGSLKKNVKSKLRRRKRNPQ